MAAHPRERIALGEGIGPSALSLVRTTANWILLVDETAQPVIIVSPAAALRSAFNLWQRPALWAAACQLLRAPGRPSRPRCGRFPAQPSPLYRPCGEYTR